MTIKLLVATRNPGKIKEYRDILMDLPVEITWLEAEGIELEVEETGSTFEENALLKALTYARLSGLLTWADDSGLEIDALGGWPGVASARHAGPDATDGERTQILLQRMEGVRYERRTAVFRCVVALATPDGQSWTASGSSSGVITDAPQGQRGFGYDPIFLSAHVCSARSSREERSKPPRQGGCEGQGIAQALFGTRRIKMQLHAKHDTELHGEGKPTSLLGSLLAFECSDQGIDKAVRRGHFLRTHLIQNCVQRTQCPAPCLIHEFLAGWRKRNDD